MTPIQQLMLGVGAKKSTYIDDVFSTFLYTGSNSSSQTFNNGVDLSGEGGMVWIKNRGSTYKHGLFDTIRGVNKRIRSSEWDGEETISNSLTSFNNNGFTIGTAGEVSDNNTKHASFSFRKAPGFFDILTYDGNATAGRQISHNLACKPGLIIVKRYLMGGSSAANWAVYHRDLTAHKYLKLNSSDQAYDYDNIWYDTEPTSTHFTVGTENEVNASSSSEDARYVAYLFAGGESTAAAARSVDFDGSGDYLSISDHADFHFGNGNFCVELWIKGTANNANRNIIGQWSSGNKAWSVFWAAGNQGHNAWGFKYSTDNSNETQVSDILLDDNQWHHIAVVRDGNDLKLYRDGILRKKSDITDVTFYDSSAELRIANDGWDSPLDCHISNVRVVKGSSVYTTSFRVPTEPLSNITNTKLLCCNGTSTTSSTVTPGTITANGDPTSSTNTPFDDPAAFKFGENGDQNVIKCGSHSNSVTEDIRIYTGWEPQWVMTKNASVSSNWAMFDCMRGIFVGSDGPSLVADSNAAENGVVGSNQFVIPHGDGFSLKYGGTAVNPGNGNNIIYIAIRRSDGYCGKPPELGTDVFAMDTGNGSSTIPAYDSGFAVDYALTKLYASSQYWQSTSRLTGTGNLETNSSRAEESLANYIWDSNVGVHKNYGSTYQAWMWKRHAGFDVVTWEGDDTNAFRRHNLGRTPEMIIFKNRDDSRSWRVYHKGLNGGTNPEDYAIALNSTSAEGSNTAYMNGTAPTSTHFVAGNDGDTNGSGDSYIALLFASVDGISKVGSYSGSTSNLTLDLGFQPRLFICKQIDAGGSWVIFDSVRGMGSGDDSILYLDSTSGSSSSNRVEATSSGITLYANTDTDVLPTNTSHKCIYYAHA